MLVGDLATHRRSPQTGLCWTGGDGYVSWRDGMVWEDGVEKRYRALGMMLLTHVVGTFSIFHLGYSLKRRIFSCSGAA